MALTPDELSTITEWHVQFVQRDPTEPWGRALEERFLHIAEDWEQLLERHKADGMRSTLHVEQVDATLAWLRQRRSDVQASPTPLRSTRSEAASAPAKEDEKPPEPARDARGQFQPHGQQRR